jgi:indole-3-glycerol phosphate synthase
MTGNLLATVVAAAERAARERERAGPARLERPPARPAVDRGAFYAALARPGFRIIAECKRRSPSRGVLCHDYRPVAIARSYERAGAAAISVLTEPTFFDGALDHLRDVTAAVSIPVLRKDFIVTEFQLVEARHAGAAAVLLIVAALDDGRLRRLLAGAAALGLAALVEVHDERELGRALEAGAEIIGVNSRNLATLEVDRSVLERLAAALPTGVLAIAESGLRTADDLQRLRALRYDAFLIGERFMTASDPGQALGTLLRSAAVAPGGLR